jgi:effector-binding domain-containing protein
MEENTAGFTYRKTEPILIMACTMVPGSFDNIDGASIAFAYWLQEHNQYTMTGQCRRIVHKGPWNEQNPDNYLTEIQIPLENK